MSSSQQEAISAPDASQRTIIFVHGYFDGPDVWGRVIDNLDLPGWSIEVVRLQVSQDGPTSSADILQQYAGQVVDVVANTVSEQAGTQAGQIVLVGHSMGGQIAELAASLLGERVSGLVLVTPAPLVGYPLPQKVMDTFKVRAGLKDVEEIKKGKRGLAVALDDEALDILVDSTLATGLDAALEQLNAWTGGHPAGAHPSAVKVPVLMIGTDDTFITEAMVSAAAQRFWAASVEKVSGAGHWPQLEQPEALAQCLVRFVRSLPRLITSSK